MKRNGVIAWREVIWHRPFTVESVIEVLTHLAATTPKVPIIWEIRGSQGKVRYLIGVNRQYLRQTEKVFAAHGSIEFATISKSDRKDITLAKQLKTSKPSLSLNTNITEAVVRAGLSAILQTQGKEEICMQIVLGASYSPTPTPNNLPDPHASWLKCALGEAGAASAESRSIVKEKNSSHGFAACVRLGASGTGATALTNILNLLSALRTLSSAGVTVKMVGESAKRMNSAYVPYHFPLKLSVKELSSLLLLPVGDTELPGVAKLHPKQMLPPSWYRNPDPGHDRTFAHSLDGKARLSISPQDSLEHTIILGPTGAGKSTTMQRLILKDIEAGRSVLVIDPKADLINDLLARIPEERDNDVVIIDPSAESPVGFNPLAFKDSYDPGLTADAILAVFQEVFKDSWGVNSQKHLSAALLTLVKAKGSSLLWLPPLLTDEHFRKKITAKVDDKIGLEPYWKEFENMKDTARRQEIAPVLNKLRQFLLRPGLRNVLGQSNPAFNLTDLFNKPRIVLVPLNKGLIGKDSAKLLGSLIVGLTWTLALSRAGAPGELRRLVSVYIDELQDYLTLPTDLSDALAQARGLGVGLTLAHQYRKQLSETVQAGIDANAKNKIIFGLQVTDAKSMAAMAPELKPADFQTLPRHNIYTSFNQNGKNTGWVSGQTLPMTSAIRKADELREKVTARYGKSGEDIKQEYLATLAKYQKSNLKGTPLPIGRRKVA